MTKDTSPDISEIENAYAYCEGVTKLHAKSFYFAAKFLPPHKRKAVYPIYAFCRHIDDEIDEIGDEDNAKAVETVEIWKSNLQNLYENKDQEPKSEDQKTVFLAWNDLLKNHKIPQNLPIELIEGVLMDTHIKRYETFEKLYVYCYRVASTVGLMSSEILGYSDKIALEFAEKLGIAMQLTNILRDVKEDAERGRIYLPLEDLRIFNVSEQQILENEFDDNFCKMMQFQIERAREFYREGEKGIPLLEKDSRLTVLLASRIYGRILDEIEKLDYNVFLGRAHTTNLKKLLSIPTIWREAKKF
ncbi:MAG: squalene/phytoene synthase family protein [Acidobacteriota bacterium]